MELVKSNWQIVRLDAQKLQDDALPALVRIEAEIAAEIHVWKRKHQRQLNT